MNDEELRIKLHRLRTPQINPATVERALERAVSALREEDSAEQIAGVPVSGTKPDGRALGDRSTNSNAWTWREWLWPSPLAWGGIASVWIAIAAANLPFHSEGPLNEAALNSQAEPLAAHQRPLYLTLNDYNAQLQELQQWTKSR
jgi:hypothetical protein